MSFGFERPFFAVAGFGAILLILFLSRFFGRVLTLKLPLGPPGGIPFRAPRGVEFLLNLLYLLELGGVLLLFSAAAGPRLVLGSPVWLNRGADILFVIDISPSMAGIDMDGRSRFDAARDLVADFAAKRPSDALGLVAVGNEASLLVPPTIDRDIFLSRLEDLRIGELGDGTALGLGLAIAALHIRNSPAPRRAVILITDGENNAGAVHPETAAAALRNAGISLWVIGVGSSGEAPIDYVDPRTNLRRTGSFDSRFDPEGLRNIARIGGGVFILAPSFGSFSEALLRVDQGEITIRRSGTLTRTRNFRTPLILAAMLLFCLTRFFRRYILGAFL